MPFFYQNLKAWRLYKRLTQEALAEKSGISRPNLVALEHGKRECTLSTLNRLAYALEISPGILLDQKPPLHRSTALGRFEIDLMARNLLHGKGRLPKHLVLIRDQAILQAGPLLRLAGMKTKLRVKKRVASVDKKAVEQVLGRLSKLLSSRLSGVAL